MIRRINAIKNLGIFNDYKEQDIPEFEKFNLIYGWNGSGKTTLSEFFNGLNSGALGRFPKLKYNITVDGKDDTYENYSQGMQYPQKIKVFNQKYVKNNINIDESSTKTIRMVLGKENKDLIDEINKDKEMLQERKEKIKIKKEEISLIKDKKSGKFTYVAKMISASGLISTRIYYCNHAEGEFNKLTEKKDLLIEDVKKNQKVLEQQQKDDVASIDAGKIIAQKLLDIVEEAKTILRKTVRASTIERINKDKGVSKWVEEGLGLHERLESKSCEFCAQPLPKELISDLLGHFNDEDKKIKREINILLESIDDITRQIQGLIVPDKACLYDNMKEEYMGAKEKIDSSAKSLLGDIKKLRKEIENKKQYTGDVLELSVNICTKEFIASIETGNVLIKKCNETTSSFDTKKKKAKDLLRNHYLSEIYDEIKDMDEVVKIKENELDILKNGNPTVPGGDIAIDDIEKEILKNEKRVSKTAKACNELNNALEAFLGRKELTFEFSEQAYLIRRKDGPAENLSEGEKTAIAFVYFTINLREEGFNIKDGIVVIDDPMSSLDSHSMIYAFAFLKNAIKDAHQSFIFTHNVDFLQLILRWLRYTKKKEARYYMINNSYDNGNRFAVLDKLDNFLLDYDGEYQYLLGLLDNIKGDTIESVYHIPNAGRKVLEYFLMFMTPSGGSMHAKMEKIKFDEDKKTAIYEFFNKESHISGGEVGPHFVQECKKYVKELLDMINTVKSRGQDKE